MWVAGEASADDRANPRDLVPATAAAAVAELSACVEAALERGGRQSVLPAAADQLDVGEIVSNAAVLLFGGIETAEGMICNAVWYLLADRDALHQVTVDRGLVDNAVDESLRLEPAAAVVDRYATSDVILGAVRILRGDLVAVSLAAAHRHPQAFPDPARFALHRPNPHRHLPFPI